MINKLLGYLALIASGIAALFYVRSKHHQEEAKHQRDRADHLEAAVETRRRVDSASAELQQKHRKEKQDASQSLDAGSRDHLSGDW